MIETGSFRPSVYSAGLAGIGEALVFKTSALNHSAIPPRVKSTTYKCSARYVVDHTPIVYRSGRYASTAGIAREGR